MQTELFQKALRQLKQKQPSPITKVMNKKIMQTDNAVRDKEIVKKKKQGSTKISDKVRNEQRASRPEKILEKSSILPEARE